jgi:Na+-driven multidrug efflux pump
MPLFGIVQAMQPIVGYNFGAKRYKKVKEIVLVTVKTLFIISLVFVILVEFFPKHFISVFTNNLNLIKESIIPLRAVMLFVPLVTVQIVASIFFQSIKEPKSAFLLSMLRQVILFIPLLFILPNYFGVLGVWLTFTITDFTAFLVSFFCIKTRLNKMIKKK